MQKRNVLTKQDDVYKIKDRGNNTTISLKRLERVPEASLLYPCEVMRLDFSPTET